MRSGARFALLMLIGLFDESSRNTAETILEQRRYRYAKPKKEPACDAES